MAGELQWVEHWAHVLYDTNENVAKAFFESADYQEYLASGGRPFKEDIFYEMKCFCIGPSKFEECACPTCTLLRENLRLLDKQRGTWHRKSDAARKAASASIATTAATATATATAAAAAAATTSADVCDCGNCDKDSAYRKATRSPSSLREFIHAPCGKMPFSALRIATGKYSSEVAPKFYRRQCCRAPLPAVGCPHGSKGLCAECGPCVMCGWELTMGSARCPLDYGNAADAEWKEFRPRIEADGKSFRDELVTVKGTRAQLMAQVEKLFLDWSPHEWIDKCDSARCVLHQCLCTLHHACSAAYMSCTPHRPHSCVLPNL